jgi:hypothetical protein
MKFETLKNTYSVVKKKSFVNFYFYVLSVSLLANIDYNSRSEIDDFFL